MDNQDSKSSSNGQLKPPSDRQHQANVHDYLAMIYRGRWWITMIFTVTMTAVCYNTFTTPPTYQASTTIMLEQRQGMGESLFGAGRYRYPFTMVNNQIEILKSLALSQAVVDHILQTPEKDSLKLFKGIGKKKTIKDVALKLRGALSISPIRDTDLIRIEVKAPSPFEAAFLANSVTAAYQNLDKDFSRGEISQVMRFLSSQLERKEKDLRTSEMNLKTFLEKSKIASLSDEASQVVEQGAEFESLYKGVLIDLESTRERLDYIKDQLGRSKESLEQEIARVSSPLVLKLRNEMAELERKIAVYISQGVSDSDPQVQFERNKLNAIKGRLTTEVKLLIVQGLPPEDPLTQAQELVTKIVEGEIDLSALSARGEALKKVVDGYQKKLESLPDKQVQLARLERSRKVDENLYMMMREKYEESRITQAGQIGKVRIIDPALQPDSPIAPRPKMNLILGAMMGLGLGLGITFLREAMDTSVRRVEDIEAMGLPVVGAIPSIEPISLNGTVQNLNEQRNGKRDRTDSGKLVTHLRPKSPVSEAYRTLRTNLQFSSSDSKISSMLVTSAGPGEGKSTTIANLAIAMSQQGVRTLLVDTDLRRPIIHHIFGLEKSRGLTNVLFEKLRFEDAVQSTGIENLDALTCGILPPNPAELLGSNRMKQLIGELKQRYDMCLFDSPPLIAVTDAAVLSKELDGVLLVVKSGKTHQEALMRGVELIRNVHARTLGVLLNDVSRANTYGSYYYYYYYHYYYYYGENGGRKRRKGRGSKSNGAGLKDGVLT